MTGKAEIPMTTLSFPVSGDAKRVYLMPGDFHVAELPTQISTILGSCVSICLWDSRKRVGAMNHYLLPEWHDGDRSSTRFGNVATLAILEGLLDLGCEPKHLKAKVFGGAALFTGAERYAVSLGAKNVDTALHMLAHAKIPVIGQDTGGQHGRKVIFDTTDCSAWSRKV